MGMTFVHCRSDGNVLCEFISYKQFTEATKHLGLFCKTISVGDIVFNN